MERKVDEKRMKIDEGIERKVPKVNRMDEMGKLMKVKVTSEDREGVEVEKGYEEKLKVVMQHIMKREQVKMLDMLVDVV